MVRKGKNSTLIKKLILFACGYFCIRNKSLENTVVVVIAKICDAQKFEKQKNVCWVCAGSERTLLA
jgi:uncharacterized protein with PIN domain